MSKQARLPFVAKLNPFVRSIAVLAALAGAASVTAGSSSNESVDLALVLAIDCSDSVDRREFRQQIDGLALAFRNPAVLEAIQTGPNRRIAVALLQWSDFPQPAKAVGWTVIDNQASVEDFARKIESARRLAVGGTSVSTAITGSVAILSEMPWQADRFVIDVSGDGTHNIGGNLESARNDALAQGIVINGLAITNNMSDLARYYRDHVAGGSGNFVISTVDYESFTHAMLQKLVREISAPVS